MATKPHGRPWKGRKDKNLLMMQQLIEACSPKHGCVLDLLLGTCECLDNLFTLLLWVVNHINLVLTIVVIFAKANFKATKACERHILRLKLNGE
jgi:hypothetical protein